MSIRTRIPSLLVLLVAVAGLVGCAPARLAPRPWLEVRSAHFVFLTDMPSEEVEPLAIDLERFRGTVAAVTDARRLDPAVPIRIYVFDRPSTFRAYTERDDIGGFIQPTPRRYYVAFSGATANEYRSTLYHEYVHFVMRNEPSAMYPAWYDEGFAGFLSTTRVEDDALVIGEIDPRTLHAILYGQRPLLAELLDSTRYAGLEGPEGSAFYAWSWLLVHYLALEHSYPDGGSFGLSMRKYIESVEGGVEGVDAFQAAWGITPRRLADSLDHLKELVGRVALPLDRLDYSDAVATRRVTEAAASRQLGELALAMGVDDRARFHFEQAIALDSDDARALSGLAVTEARSGEHALAESTFERALVLAPDDPKIRVDRGGYWLARATADPEAPDREAWLARAREDLERGLELAPDDPEVLAAFGAMRLAADEIDEAVKVLIRAFRILPNDWRIQSALMNAYARAGAVAEADRLARRLLVAAPDRETVESLRPFLRESEPERR